MKKGVITQFRIKSIAGGTVQVTGRGFVEFQLTLPQGKVYSRSL